jgi:hypothetical protein
MLTSCFQLCHLALSTRFHAHGCGVLHGPTAACCSNAYRSSRGSSLSVLSAGSIRVRREGEAGGRGSGSDCAARPHDASQPQLRGAPSAANAGGRRGGASAAARSQRSRRGAAAGAAPRRPCYLAATRRRSAPRGTDPGMAAGTPPSLRLGRGVAGAAPLTVRAQGAQSGAAGRHRSGVRQAGSAVECARRAPLPHHACCAGLMPAPLRAPRTHRAPPAPSEVS